MSKSGNQWPASADQAEIEIKIYTIVRGIRPVRLRCAKAAAPLLVKACKEWHKKVEKLKNTGVDIWPSRHPQGDADGNFTKEQQAAVLKICKKYGLRSGGTYKTAKPDWMHIEIDITPAKAAVLIASLKGK